MRVAARRGWPNGCRDAGGGAWQAAFSGLAQRAGRPPGLGRQQLALDVMATSSAKKEIQANLHSTADLTPAQRDAHLTDSNRFASALLTDQVCVWELGSSCLPLQIVVGTVGYVGTQGQAACELEMFRVYVCCAVVGLPIASIGHDRLAGQFT